MRKISFILAFTLLIITLHAQDSTVREEFDQLDNWEPLIFPKIERHSEYQLIREGELTLLEGKSNNSASGLIYTGAFDIYKTPVMEWRWKIESVLQKGNARHKKGDDYPFRLYVIFEYDPDEAKGLQGIQYELAKIVYGEYPPDSALNYVWGNVNWDNDYIANAYTSQAVMISSDWGNEKAGEWQTHRVNIIEDYRRIFNRDPPEKASLAIMTDSDDTGESTHAYLDYISLEE
jgi:hypothetical protein